jgi:hypothetical protein
MPRGRREASIVSLVNRLDTLDAKRRDLVADIQRAAGALSGGEGHLPSPFGKRKGGRRKGFKLSAEARAKIAAAQKKRWAKQKAAEK